MDEVVVLDVEYRLLVSSTSGLAESGSKIRTSCGLLPWLDQPAVLRLIRLAR